MNTLKTVFLMTLIMVLLMLVGSIIGGERGVIMAFIFSLLMNFGAYWFSDKIVLMMYKGKEITESDAPRLYSMVARLASSAQIPMPKVYIIPGNTPNAFATGRNPQHAAVAVTTGILRILDRKELMGVLAHELAHIKHRDTLIGSIAATFAGAISMLASMAQWGAILGGGKEDEEGGGGILGTFIFSMIASIAATLVQLAISRSREYLADEGGAKLVGEPKYLANALYKLHHGVERFPMQANPATAHMFIVNPLRGDGVMRLFSTHPPMEERIERLRNM